MLPCACHVHVQGMHMHAHGVSRRECTIRWSYAAADHALGARHAALLVEHLEKVLAIWMHMCMCVDAVH